MKLTILIVFAVASYSASIAKAEPEFQCSGNGVGFTGKATCSSVHSANYDCQNAMVQDGRDWASKGEGVGAWIDIRFARVYNLKEFIYQQRTTGSCAGGACEMNKDLKLECYVYDVLKGSISVPVKANREEQHISIDKPLYCDRVKVITDSVYTTTNNGAAFIGFAGIPCNELIDAKEATCSSEHSAPYGCGNALVLDDKDWASKGEGAGAWIDIKLGNIYKLEKLEYRQRATGDCAGGLCEMNKIIRLDCFKNKAAAGSTTVSLVNNRELQTVELPQDKPLVCDEVKLTTTDVYSTTNNGANYIGLVGSRAIV